MTSVGSQRWARAVASRSAAIARACGNRSCRISDSTSAGSGAAAVVGGHAMPPASSASMMVRAEQRVQPPVPWARERVLVGAATGGGPAFGGQDGIQVAGGEAAVHGGMPSAQSTSARPANADSSTAWAIFCRIRSVPTRGGFFEPHRGAGPERQERLLGGGAGPDPVVTGNLVAVLREMAVVDGGAARGGTAVPGDLDRAAVVESADDHFVGAVVVTDPHTLAQ